MGFFSGAGVIGIHRTAAPALPCQRVCVLPRVWSLLAGFSRTQLRAPRSLNGRVAAVRPLPRASCALRGCIATRGSGSFAAGCSRAGDSAPSLDGLRGLGAPLFPGDRAVSAKTIRRAVCREGGRSSPVTALPVVGWQRPKGSRWVAAPRPRPSFRPRRRRASCKNACSMSSICSAAPRPRRPKRSLTWSRTRRRRFPTPVYP